MHIGAIIGKGFASNGKFFRHSATDGEAAFVVH
jgi:hypothetical protein